MAGLRVILSFFIYTFNYSYDFNLLISLFKILLFIGNFNLNIVSPLISAYFYYNNKVSSFYILYIYLR